jgi:hypothetical protein
MHLIKRRLYGISFVSIRNEAHNPRRLLTEMFFKGGRGNQKKPGKVVGLRFDKLLFIFAYARYELNIRR